MNHPTIHPYSPIDTFGREPQVILNESLLNELWINNYSTLVYYTSQFVKNNLLSEDIAAEAFTKLWNLRENFDNIPSIRSFLYVTVKNACFDLLRSQKIHDRIHKDIQYTSDYAQEMNEGNYDLMYAEYIQQLQVELRALPEGCRKVFKLSFFSGLSTREIAGKLGLAEQTVRNQKVKANQLLSSAILKK